MPFPYTDPFDTTTPTAVEGLSSGDDRIRELKRAINERLTDALNNWPGNAATVTPKIANLSILTAMLADAAVTAVKLADGSVGTTKLVDDAVTAAKIAALAVTTAELADSAVATGKIADLAVTDAKIAAVSGAKINDASITGAKIVDASISGSKIALLAIIEGLIAAGAVTEAKIAAGAVTNARVADATLEIAKLSATARGLIAVTKYADLVISTPVSVGLNGAKILGTVALAGVVDNDNVQCSYPAVFAGYPDGDSLLEMMVYGIATSGQIKVICNNTTTSVAQNWPASTIRCRVTKTAADWGL